MLNGYYCCGASLPTPDLTKQLDKLQATDTFVVTDRAGSRISVIMPCFNAAQFVDEAVSSVLRQTHPHVELIVIDDGSTDGSKEILRRRCDRLTLIEQPNQGPYSARNLGLQRASGEYVAFLDADDWWREDCLAKLHAALSTTDAAIAYCGWQNVGAPNRSNEPYVPPDYEEGSKLEAFLRAASPWPIHAALVRRTELLAAGGFDESLQSCMDYDLWLRLGGTRPIVRVPEVLAFYRFHGQGQITSKEWVQARNTWLVKQKFVNTHPDVVAGLSKRRLRQLIHGGLAHRAYRAYWRRDLASAQKIFRMLLKTGYWGVKDVKYLLPALLPARVYRKLVGLADDSR
jgi:glycosyltransferase involved in cell wall biosynthesis